jgi:hypothetical protein
MEQSESQGSVARYQEVRLTEVQKGEYVFGIPLDRQVLGVGRHICFPEFGPRGQGKVTITLQLKDGYIEGDENHTVPVALPRLKRPWLVQRALSPAHYDRLRFRVHVKELAKKIWSKTLWQEIQDKPITTK